jgi:hypothetical protein
VPGQRACNDAAVFFLAVDCVLPWVHVMARLVFVRIGCYNGALEKPDLAEYSGGMVELDRAVCVWP